VAGPPRLICASADLADSGRGVRFEVDYRGERVPAFAVRYRGTVYGYLNRCRHVPMELDWSEGQFFDPQGNDLICSTHGATYAASSGRCLGGPCNGQSLLRLALDERDSGVYYTGSANER
jgi:nitrite reductase/ring-hydroxylating ferredoxin subunit